MKILGIDPSLTGTGIVVIESAHAHAPVDTLFAQSFKIGVKNLASGLSSTVDRLKAFALECGLDGDAPGVAMGDLISDVDHAIIEGYAFRSFRGISLAELGTVFRLALGEWGVPFVSVPPLTLKKFAGISDKVGTKGKKKSQPKKAMSDLTLKRWDFSAGDHNIADAYALARLGLVLFNGQNDELFTRPMKEAVTKVREQITT